MNYSIPFAFFITSKSVFHFDMSMTGLETLQQDLVNVFEKWIPICRYEGMYLHPGKKALDFAESVGEDNFGCHNTDAHLRSSIIGRSVTVVIDDGVADLGEFGRIRSVCCRRAIKYP